MLNDGRGGRARGQRRASSPTAARWRARWRISAPCSAATASTRCATTPRRSWHGLGPSAPIAPTMLHTQGVAYLLEGDLDRSDVFLTHAF